MTRARDHGPGGHARFYDGLEDKWGQLDEANAERVEKTISLIPEETETVLDVGCGDGAVTRPLAENGIEVTGIDISEKALSHFKGNAVTGSIDKLPFPDASFDVAICAEVIEHLPLGVYEKALKEMERVASKAIIITTPFREHLPSSHTRCSNCKSIYHVSYHIRNFETSDYENLFDDFKLEKIMYIQTWQQKPLASRVRHSLEVWAYREHLVCPLCGYDKGEREPQWIREPRGISVIKRGFLGLLILLERFLPGKQQPRWMAGLFLPRGRLHSAKGDHPLTPVTSRNP